MDDVTYLGKDAEGYKVWQHRDGRVLGAFSAKTQAAQAFDYPSVCLSLEEYLKEYGPITP